MRITLLLPAVLMVVLSACSGPSRQGLPTVPGMSPASHPSASSSSRTLLGIWDVTISEDRQTVDVKPARSMEMHLNVTRMLEVTPCHNCLTVGTPVPLPPDKLQVDVTLKHPFPGLLKYTGFDVRGIFISQADYAFPPSGRSIAWGDGVPKMVNYDGYTSVFNPTEYPDTLPGPPAFRYIPGKKATGGDLTSTLNPFIAYRKDAPRRMFEAGGSETKTVVIQAPKGPIHFGYAVDASWYPVDTVVDPLVDFPLSANCLEAYQINVDAGTGMMPEDGGETGVDVRTYDHQGLDTIESVTVLSPQLFVGEVALQLQPDTGDPYAYYRTIIKNDLSAGSGTYPLLVRVVDKDSDPNLGQIDAWQVYSLQVQPRKGWAKTWGGELYCPGLSVTADALGNTYVAGYFNSDSVDFDPGSGVDIHTCIGYVDAFLSKFDPSGNLLWARTWGGSKQDYSRSVAIDSSGNAYVTGCFHDIVDFDPGTGVDEHTSNGEEDIFLSKFDSSGNFLWAKTWGGTSYEWGYSVAIDDSGNAYLTGWYYSDTVDFDPGPGEEFHFSNGGENAFLSKFDSSGNFLGARTWGVGSQHGLRGFSVALDSSANAYITGFFDDTVDFDPGPGEDIHTANKESDVFLSKFDSTGNFLWAMTWGGSGHDEGRSVAVDTSGNAYVTGSFEDSVDFDPGPGEDFHTYHGDTLDDAFLSKFDSNGNFLYAKTWGSIDWEGRSGVALDGSGNAYVTGSFIHVVDFDPGPGVDNHTTNGDVKYSFLSKFDSYGIFLWARTWGGFGDSTNEASSVTVDGLGNAYVTGDFVSISKAADFDPGTGVDKHVSIGCGDAFLSKFPPDGNW